MNPYLEGLLIGGGAGLLLAVVIVAAILGRVKTAAFKAGSIAAVDSAAMVAYRMGRLDVRDAIHALVDKQRLRERAPWLYEDGLRAAYPPAYARGRKA